MIPTYLDNAATTPVRPDVLEAMLPFLTATWGNPSSAHRFGRSARAGFEQAKRELAQAIGAEPNQIIFTSGGTEADNLAVIGAALAARDRGGNMHVVTTAIEHKAVLAAAHEVVHLGGTETILPVDGEGLVDLDDLDAALAQQPALVSIMWVNNEVGTVQPIADIAQRCHAADVPFHSDGVQAFGKVPIDFAASGCQLLSVSGHKIGAPKGIGALVVRDRKLVDGIIHGGGQQYGIRPGTENVAGAVAMGRAAKFACAELDAQMTRLDTMRARLATALRSCVSDVVIHGSESSHAPHVLSVGVPQADASALLMHLDLAGIACSGGSACTTGSVEPSHVLVAMGIDPVLAHGTIRFSLGHDTTDADIDRVIEAFPDVVARVRQLHAALNRA